LAQVADTSAHRSEVISSMGTFAKKLGQLSARSLETESRNILRTVAANKVPGSLSQALDTTLKKGHDMRVFGLGTAASMANRARYARFTASMHAVYSAMEQELDAAAAGNMCVPVKTVWERHGPILRRANSLELDLADVAGEADVHAAANSPATIRYVDGIHAASGTPRLLGHLYCRYFADLFGGQMLALPTRLALSLPMNTPRHYSFDLPAPEGGTPSSVRKAYIEDVYQSINEAGNLLEADAFNAVVEEALAAFAYNVGVYSEERLLADATRGVINVATGYAASQIRGS